MPFADKTKGKQLKTYEILWAGPKGALKFLQELGYNFIKDVSLPQKVKRSRQKL